MTIIHLLPEVFYNAGEGIGLGYFVSLGFFIQLALEHFSGGIEHGHVHIHKSTSAFSSRSVFLLISLSIHAFLEGTLLAHPNIFEHEHNSKALLIGIVLHKIPAAIALCSVLMSLMLSRSRIVLYITIFAVASPIGLLLSDNLIVVDILSGELFLILFAIVSGNFLHISTTIFFATDPEHKLSAQRLLISILGALIAVLAEFLL
ncbi:MAG: ZIP family metal transporter [Leptolyngbya sp. SIO1D8]|nr:ZIP family metal transporter [Leptolyngbya sp. SIO1D8]